MSGADELYALPKPTAVKLTDDELLLLDGRCSDELQEVVDLTKRRLVEAATHPELPPRLARLIADVLSEAKQNGRLAYRRLVLSHCQLCGRSGGYANYQSGPRRGRPNYGRPIYLGGVDLAVRFVTVKGSAALGGCEDCIATVLPSVVDALHEVPVQLPNALYGGGTRWTRWDRVRCTKCGWEGHEGEMGRLRTLMGDGTYPGICPSCKAEKELFSAKPFERRDGFELTAHTAPGSTG